MQIPRKGAIALLAISMATPLAFAQERPDGFGQGRDGGPDRQEGNQWPGMQRHGGSGEGHWSHERGMHGRRGHGREHFGLERIVNNPSIRVRLGITPEQAAKIRQQASDFRKAEIRNRAEVGVKRIELRDLLAADKPDRAAIDKKLQEISAARLAVEKAGIDYRLAMRSALTPEQHEKLKKMWEEERQHGPGRERMHGPRGMEHHDHDGQGAKPPANPNGED